VTVSNVPADHAWSGAHTDVSMALTVTQNCCRSPGRG
jgi:hypothetical protein